MLGFGDGGGDSFGGGFHGGDESFLENEMRARDGADTEDTDMDMGVDMVRGADGILGSADLEHSPGRYGPDDDGRAFHAQGLASGRALTTAMSSRAQLFESRLSAEESRRDAQTYLASPTRATAATATDYARDYMVNMRGDDGVEAVGGVAGRFLWGREGDGDGGADVDGEGRRGAAGGYGGADTRTQLQAWESAEKAVGKAGGRAGPAPRSEGVQRRVSVA